MNKYRLSKIVDVFKTEKAHSRLFADYVHEQNHAAYCKSSCVAKIGNFCSATTISLRPTFTPVSDSIGLQYTVFSNPLPLSAQSLADDKAVTQL